MAIINSPFLTATPLASVDGLPESAPLPACASHEGHPLSPCLAATYRAILGHLAPTPAPCTPGLPLNLVLNTRVLLSLGLLPVCA